MLGSAHASLGLSNSQVHVLIELERNKTLSLVQLANYLNLEKSSMSRLIDDLILERLVSTAEDSKDKRKKMISLSAAGKEKLKAIHHQANARVASAIKKLSSDEQQKIVTGLELYARALSISKE